MHLHQFRRLFLLFQLCLQSLNAILWRFIFILSIFYQFLEISSFDCYCLSHQRNTSHLFFSKSIKQRSVSQRHNPKNRSKFLQASVSFRIMIIIHALSSSKPSRIINFIQNIGLDNNRHHLRVVILNQKVQSNIIAIINLFDDNPHFLDSFQFRVVQLHKMPTDECNSSKPNSIIISFLHSAIAYSTHLSILEISSCEGNYWGNIAYCILLPCFKSSRKLLASNVDIIIDTEVNFGLALGRDRIAPIH